MLLLLTEFRTTESLKVVKHSFKKSSVGKLFKGPGNEYFKVRELGSLCYNYSTLPLCGSNHRQYVNKRIWLCSSKNLYKIDLAARVGHSVPTPALKYIGSVSISRIVKLAPFKIVKIGLLCQLQ